MVSLLAEWIGEIASDDDGLVSLRNTLPSNRAVGIVRIAETQVIRRDGDRKPGSHGSARPEPLRLGELEGIIEAVQVGHSVLRLPAPIVPTSLIESRDFAKIVR